MGPALHGNAVFKEGRNLHCATGPVEAHHRRRRRARARQNDTATPSAASAVAGGPPGSPSAQPPFGAGGGGGGGVVVATWHVASGQTSALAWASQLSAQEVCA